MSEAKGCTKYHQSYQTKVIIHRFKMSQYSVLTQISLKNGSLCQENKYWVKRSNVSGSIRCHRCGLYFKAMVIKHAEQTTVK
jgi:CRISPR/Cas system-associated protein endoribonuclease Cas2